jgi:hypothetical protein
MARFVNTQRRFSLAYLALAALVGAAIGTFVVLVERPAPKPPPAWSAWTPTAQDIGAQQQQIAEHVAAQYRMRNGKELVSVLPRGPGTPDNPIQAVAFAKTLNPTQQSDISALIRSDKTAMYILCGDGNNPKCSIKEGKPSKARGAVLRREALELALYTFRYVDGINSVVAFFPPRKGGTAAYAFFFVKDAFKDQLHAPLRRTLPEAKAPRPGGLSPTEQRTVDALTFPREFLFAVRSDQNGARVLVLVPAQS